jgi:PAS domain S-box-containing protein
MGARPTMHARRVDGGLVPVDISLSPLAVASGRLVLVCIRDATAREQVATDLRESERRYRMVVEAASEVFYHVAVETDALQGRVTFVSAQCERLTGLPPGEFVANPGRWSELIHPEDLPRVAEQTQAMMAARREETRVYRIRHTDGAYRHVADRVVPLTDREGRLVGYQGVARDITALVYEEEERRGLEARVLRAERMEALGRLAGGIAHDFNNVLTIILGGAEMALRALEPSQAAHREVERMAQAGRHAAVLTQQLLAFSRRQVIAPRPVNLAAYLRTIDGLLRRTLTEQMELVFSIREPLGLTFIDPSQIDQVLINLVANARDATPAGGTVMISTADATVDERLAASTPGLAPGEYVQLTVSDTGAGMDEATLRNVFEPFFTTKPEGQGTGIGLASVYGIMKQNGGFVRIQSALGRGTVVDLYLPRFVGEAIESGQDAPAPRPSGGDETVLVVEDHSGVRQLARRLLAALGYRVLEAERPSAALALCDTHRGAIHLLLSDVVMPEMSGPELARLVAAKRPGIATLFISGYVDRPLSTGQQFLSKPFNQTSLAAAVRQALQAGNR